MTGVRALPLRRRFRTSGPAGNRKRSRAGALGTAITSLVALAGAGTYIAAPATNVLAVTVRAVGKAHVATGEEIIYGSARDASGNLLRGVKVTVGHDVSKRFVADASATTGHDGTFRIVAALPDGKYKLTVALRSGGQSASASRPLELRTGVAYLVRIVRRVRNAALYVVPVRGY